RTGRRPGRRSLAPAASSPCGSADEQHALRHGAAEPPVLVGARFFRRHMPTSVVVLVLTVQVLPSFVAIVPSLLVLPALVLLLVLPAASIGVTMPVTVATRTQRE